MRLLILENPLQYVSMKSNQKIIDEFTKNNIINDSILLVTYDEKIKEKFKNYLVSLMGDRITINLYTLKDNLDSYHSNYFPDIVLQNQEYMLLDKDSVEEVFKTKSLTESGYILERYQLENKKLIEITTDLIGNIHKKEYQINGSYYQLNYDVESQNISSIKIKSSIRENTYHLNQQEQIILNVETKEEIISYHLLSENIEFTSFDELAKHQIERFIGDLSPKIVFIRKNASLKNLVSPSIYYKTF